MPKKLYVTGFDPDLSEEKLRTRFARWGDVIDTHMVDSRKSAYAFVTFLREPSAELAASELDGAEIAGDEIQVEVAHNQKLPKHLRGVEPDPNEAPVTIRDIFLGV